MKRDAIDQRIIALLNEDARRSNRNIGRALELSEGAVRQRIRKLEDNKVITLGVVTDKRASGLMCSAYVRVKTSPRHTRAVAKAIAGHETVQFVGLSFGAYDIIERLSHEGTRLAPVSVYRAIDALIAQLVGAKS